MYRPWGWFITVGVSELGSFLNHCLPLGKFRLAVRYKAGVQFNFL